MQAVGFSSETKHPIRGVSLLAIENPNTGAPEAFGVLETHAWTPAIVALDVMEKAAEIRLLQVELNDFLGTCIKIAGNPSNVAVALDAGFQIAEQMKGKPVRTLIPRVSDEAMKGIDSTVEFNQLIQQNVVRVPNFDSQSNSDSETSMSASHVQALGFIETQGFTAVFEAVDTACKAAQVEVVGKEKLGGGYVTIVLRGDVAAVRAAIDAARPKVEGLGTLIAAHVVARPSESVLAILP